MKHPSNYVLLAASLMLIAGVAFAGDPPHAAMGQGASHATSQEPRAHVDDEFSRLDVNHDGVLSKAEMAKHPKAAHMAMVDENRDGVLSRDEFMELEGM